MKKDSLEIFKEGLSTSLETCVQKNQLLDNFDFRVGSNPHPPPHHPLSVQPSEVNFSNDNAFAFALQY